MTVTIEEGARVFARFATSIRNKLLRDAFREEMKKARKDIVEGYKKTAIGSRIFKARGGPRLLVKTLRSRVQGSGAYEGGISVRGMAALIEEGGKTKPHPIRPKKRTLLKFDVGAGTAFARRVEHPGSRVPKFPVALNRFRALASTVPQSVERALRATAAEHGF